jgi:hypothetical protein
MLAFDAFQTGRLAGQWLVCLGLFIGGIIIIFVGELLVESFKRDGSGA